MDTDPVCMDNLADSINWTLLLRHLAGEDTPAEAAAIAKWIDGAAGRGEYVASLRRIVETADAAADGFDRNAGWRALAERYALGAAVPELHAESQPQSTDRRISVPYREGEAVAFRRMWRGHTGIVAAMGAAACAALGLGVAIGALRSSARVGASRAGREYVTAAGQRLSLTLVDGTQLTLAPASRVRVVGDREIELEGEGYFRVVHDAAHPFAVRTRGAIARDVGTAFDVRAYPEDAGAWIAVADGAVAIGTLARCPAGSGPSCEIQARMGDVATVAAGTVTVTHGADVTALTSWARGMLTFTDVPLRSVVLELRRWYGADVAIGDQGLAERRVTIAFGQEPVGEAVKFLAATAGAVVERHVATMVLRIASPRTER